MKTDCLTQNLKKWVPAFKPEWVQACSAGFLASVALLLEVPGETRWLLAQYTAVRAAQCVYEHYRKKSEMLRRIGDRMYTAIFALCSGQLVYSFVVRPDVLDHEYNGFLTRVTRMPVAAISAIRGHLLDGHLSFHTIEHEIGKKFYPTGFPDDQLDFHLRRTPKILDCALIHPEEPSCPKRIVDIWPYIFRMMFPVYASLHTIPPLVFGLKRVMANPLKFSEACLKNSIRSSSFMATYILIFQALLCTHREMFRRGIVTNDYKMNYWIMGFLSSASVLIEKNTRCIELSLYVLYYSCNPQFMYFSFCQRPWWHSGALSTATDTDNIGMYQQVICGSFPFQWASSW